MLSEQSLIKSKIKVYACLLGGFVLVLLLFFAWTNKDKLRFILKNEEYPERILNILNAQGFNDCYVDDGKIYITGNDAYVVFETEPLWVYDISVNSLSGYLDSYKIYYSLGQGFTEEKVAFKKGNSGKYIIGDYVNEIRLDFEQASNGDSFRIDKKGSMFINMKEDYGYHLQDCIQIFWQVFLYIIGAGVYMVFLIKKKQGTKTIGIVYVYLLLMGSIVISVFSKSPDLSTIVFTLAIVVLGAFFWTNNTEINE